MAKIYFIRIFFSKSIIISCFFLLLFGCTSKSSEKEKTKMEHTDQPLVAEKKNTGDEKMILFFGNSLTAGYGLDLSAAFPALIQRKLDSLGYRYRVVNAGLSGETSAAGSERLGWVLKQKVDIFVLELGANDGLRGLPLAETKRNLQKIIDSVRRRSPEAKILLAGMQMPPNMGKTYTAAFTKIYPELAAANNLPLIPFLLKDVAAQPALNLADGIHPNKAGQKIVAETVWEHLKPLLVAD